MVSPDLVFVSCVYLLSLVIFMGALLVLSNSNQRTLREMVQLRNNGEAPVNENNGHVSKMPKESGYLKRILETGQEVWEHFIPDKQIVADMEEKRASLRKKRVFGPFGGVRTENVEELAQNEPRR